jgi:aldose 1-epimerase
VAVGRGGPIEVEVLPAAGARLHRLRVRGHDLLRTPSDTARHVDDPYFWGCYPMAPWCNRLPSGPALVAGRAIDLPASFPDGTAIHGQTSRRAWAVVDAGPGAATFRIEAGGDGWPWPYTVEEQVRVDDGRLRLVLRLTNESDEPMPAGLGFHPWFRRPVRVAIAAALVHPSNLATEARPVPVSGILDRHRLEELPDGLDAAWTDLGDPPVILEWTDAGIRAELTVAGPPGSPPFIVAASPAGIDAVAVEPETHAPDGLRRLTRGEPGGLVLVAPGASLALTATLGFGSSGGSIDGLPGS